MTIVWLESVLLVSLGITFANVLAVGTSNASSSGESGPSEIGILALFPSYHVTGTSPLSSSSLPAGDITRGVSSGIVVASIAEMDFGDIPSFYTAVGDGKILYDSSKWELIGNCSEVELVSTSWARFRHSISSSSTLKTSTPPSVTVCTMAARWDKASWTQPSAVAAAAEVATRLGDACGANDTVALVFSSTVPDAVANYLEGASEVDHSTSPLVLHDASNFMVSAASASASRRMFFRPGSGTCPLPATAYPSTGISVDKSAIQLVTGAPCTDGTKKSTSSTDSMPSAPPPPVGDSGNNSSSISSETESDSSWEQQRSLVVLVCCALFLVGSGGLIYVLRRKQYFRSSQTSKDEKELTTNLAYVLGI